MIGLLAGAGVAAIAIGTWLALAGDDDPDLPGLAVSEPAGPAPDAPEPVAPAPAAPDQAPDPGEAPGPTGTGDGQGSDPTSTPAPDATTPTAPDPENSGPLEERRCETATYSVIVPPGWSEHDCTLFSPSILGPAPGPDVRPEIDLAWTTAETYESALARVESRFTVLEQTTTDAGGHEATVYVLEEQIGDRTGRRTVYVVDAPAGVLFSSANELVNEVGPIDGPLRHYRASVVALERMMTSARF